MHTTDLCPFILFFIIVENTVKGRGGGGETNWNIFEKYFFYDYYAKCLKIFENVLNIWTRRIRICRYSDFPIVVLSKVEINVSREFLSRK